MLRDASGELRLFASEEALLSMTGAASKDEFLEQLSSDTLPRRRISGRVHRSLKTLHRGTSEEKEVVNLTFLAAAPMFIVPGDGKEAYNRYQDSTAFADSGGTLPRMLSQVQTSSDGCGLRVTHLDGQKSVEVTGGILSLLQVTAACKPVQHGVTALQFSNVVDLVGKARSVAARPNQAVADQKLTCFRGIRRQSNTLY